MKQTIMFIVILSLSACSNMSQANSKRSLASAGDRDIRIVQCRQDGNAYQDYKLYPSEDNGISMFKREWKTAEGVNPSLWIQIDVDVRGIHRPTLEDAKRAPLLKTLQVNLRASDYSEKKENYHQNTVVIHTHDLNTPLEISFMGRDLLLTSFDCSEKP